MSPLHAWTLEYQMLGQGQVKATLEEAFPAKITHMHTCEPCTYHAPALPNHSTKSTFYKHGVIFSNKLFDCAVNEKSQNDNEEENGERPLIFDGMLWQIPLEELQLKLQSLYCPSHYFVPNFLLFPSTLYIRAPLSSLLHSIINAALEFNLHLIFHTPSLTPLLIHFFLFPSLFLFFFPASICP